MIKQCDKLTFDTIAKIFDVKQINSLGELETSYKKKVQLDTVFIFDGSNEWLNTKYIQGINIFLIKKYSNNTSTYFEFVSNTHTYSIAKCDDGTKLFIETMCFNNTIKISVCKKYLSGETTCIFEHTLFFCV